MCTKQNILALGQQYESGGLPNLTSAAVFDDGSYRDTDQHNHTAMCNQIHTKCIIFGKSFCNF
jgi:hypothetical protein